MAYDLYYDNQYVDWLRQEHPNSLPDGLINNLSHPASIQILFLRAAHHGQ